MQLFKGNFTFGKAKKKYLELYRSHNDLKEELGVLREEKERKKRSRGAKGVMVVRATTPQRRYRFTLFKQDFSRKS